MPPERVPPMQKRIVIVAGGPFGTPGSTNMIHVVRLKGDELKGYGF